MYIILFTQLISSFLTGVCVFIYICAVDLGEHSVIRALRLPLMFPMMWAHDARQHCRHHWQHVTSFHSQRCLLEEKEINK